MYHKYKATGLPLSVLQKYVMLMTCKQDINGVSAWAKYNNFL